MNIGASLHHLTALWDRNHLKYTVLQVGEGTTIMISEQGGRIFGPFFEANQEGFYWTHPALNSPDSFAQFIAANEWNLGGDRNWIGPEIQFLYQNRTCIAES
ncbi:MAG: hypothetical protein IH586_00170, partial [Anaerolineaceae bacterium]|nr:hypothetical protein [Anaerolineaceae bacterium]